MSSYQAPPSNQFTQAATAQSGAQQQLVAQQTQQNRADQNNPFGSSDWQQDPTTGQWTQNVSLSGQQPQALQAQQGVQSGLSQGAQGMVGQAVNSLGQPINTSGMTGLFNFGGPQQTNQQAQDAVTQQMAPQLAQRRAAMETQLANQGITRGSEAWTNAQDQLARDENNAHLQGVKAGFDQGASMNNQNINYGNFNQGQRGFQLGEAQTLRQQPLKDIQSMLQGQGVQAPTFGQYGQAGVANAPNYLGAQQSEYNQYLDTQNANADARTSNMNGLFGLGGAVLGSQYGQDALKSFGSYLGGYF